MKFAAEDLDVILYSNVEFRKIQYIEDCKKVSKPLLVCYTFLSDLDKIANVKSIKMY